jgi:hypothetical protein
MHRKAEEEAASRADGDGENAAKRRPGMKVRGEYLARDTSVPRSVILAADSRAAGTTSMVE